MQPSERSGAPVLDGTIPALVTPFEASGGVDISSMERHVDWLLNHGVSAVSPLGTTGEGPSLSLDERLAVIKRLAPRAAVVAGTGCTSLPETIELSRAAVAAGAAALLIAPPAYYAAEEAGTEEYFLRLFDALPGDGRIVLYHIPQLTGVPITASLLRTLGNRFGPLLLGVKDSGGDTEHTKAWVREFPDLLVLSGSDRTAAEHYAAGGRGTLTMLANVFPERLESIRAGDDGDSQAFLAELRALVAELPEIAAVKHLVHLIVGLPRSTVRPPLRDLLPEEELRLDAWLDRTTARRVSRIARSSIG